MGRVQRVGDWREELSMTPVSQEIFASSCECLLVEENVSIQRLLEMSAYFYAAPYCFLYISMCRQFQKVSSSSRTRQFFYGYLHMSLTSFLGGYIAWGQDPCFLSLHMAKDNAVLIIRSIFKGRKEKFRKAIRLKGKKGGRKEGKFSHIRFIGKFDPDKNFTKVLI